MNLKIANLIISDLRILRLQGFKARNGVRRILTLALSPNSVGGEGESSSRLLLVFDACVSRLNTHFKL